MNMKLKTYFSFGAAWFVVACGEAASTDDASPGGSTSGGATSSGVTTNAPVSPSSSAPNISPSTSVNPGNTTSANQQTTGGSPNVSDTGSDESSTTGRPRPPWNNSSDEVTSEGEGSSGPSPVTSAPVSGEPSGETMADTSEPQGPIGEDPLTAAATCSSDMYWERGENDRMRPGEACIACHTAENEGPRYAIAGTLYPTGHEPNDCNGISGMASGATVVIVDANGQEHELTPNSVGNFYFNGNIAKPYTAKVVSEAGERLMVTPQQDGDCNKCHTPEGTQGAPGRVVVPF